LTGRRQLKIKPYTGYDPNKKPRTPAQEAALRRTWGIVQLRSLWVLSFHVRTPWRLRLIRWLIDGELASRGAERHGVRFRRDRREFEAEMKRHQAMRAKAPPSPSEYDDLSDIPF